MTKDIYYFGHDVAVRFSKNTAELLDKGVVIKTAHGWSEASKLQDEAQALAESRMGH